MDKPAFLVDFMSICKDGALCKKWLSYCGLLTVNLMFMPQILQLSFYLQVLQSQKRAGKNKAHVTQI